MCWKLDTRRGYLSPTAITVIMIRLGPCIDSLGTISSKFHTVQDKYPCFLIAVCVCVCVHVLCIKIGSHYVPQSPCGDSLNSRSRKVLGRWEGEKVNEWQLLFPFFFSLFKNGILHQSCDSSSKQIRCKCDQEAIAYPQTLCHLIKQPHKHLRIQPIVH